MTKQQLTRLFIVIVSAVAIVFVPYYLNQILVLAIPGMPKDGVLPSWFLGLAITGILFLITMAAINIGRAIINFIKNGK